MPSALDLALESKGDNRAARRAMMAMTTSSSVSVNPAFDFILPSLAACEGISSALCIKPSDRHFGQINIVRLAQQEDHHFRDVFRVDHRLAFQTFTEIGAF